MIEVINYTNKDYEQARENIINYSYDEVRTILPKLPRKVKIYFGSQNIVKETGVGGFAYAEDIITVSLDPCFKDSELQNNSIRPMIFHESMHLFQNYTGTGLQYPALEGAVYEGMATVFEHTYTGAHVPWGDYSDIDEEKLIFWKNQLAKFGIEDYYDNVNDVKWLFYHPEFNEKWIAYRVGSWITNRVLQKYNLQILDLSEKTAKEVIEMF